MVQLRLFGILLVLGFIDANTMAVLNEVHMEKKAANPERKQRDREQSCGAGSCESEKKKRRHLHPAAATALSCPSSTSAPHSSSPSTRSASLPTAPTRRATGEASMDPTSLFHRPLEHKLQAQHARSPGTSNRPCTTTLATATRQTKKAPCHRAMTTGYRR